jgi:histidinol-phosphate aminotransferase
MRNTFSVSSVAQAAALAAMDDQNHVARAVANNAVQAQLLIEGLSEFEYRVTPTAANFVYCDVREDASVIARRLLEEGVSVRPLGAWGARHCIRVSIGTPEQNLFFLQAVRRITAPNSSQPAARR